MRISLLLAPLLLIPVAHAASEGPPMQAVAQCFWVYAPIFEAAKAENEPATFTYAQKRTAFLGPYFQALKTDPAFKAIFQQNLEEDKRKAIALRESLKAAIRNGNVGQYRAAMNRARACDQQLGLPSSDVPEVE